MSERRDISKGLYGANSERRILLATSLIGKLYAALARGV